MTHSYEALDRTHCIINSIQVNLVEHKFYDDCEEYRELVDEAIKKLSEAYRKASWELAK